MKYLFVLQQLVCGGVEQFDGFVVLFRRHQSDIEIETHDDQYHIAGPDYAD